MSAERLPVVSIDQVDVIELIELVESWLAHAAPALAADLARFVGSQAERYGLVELRAELFTRAARLTTAPGGQR